MRSGSGQFQFMEENDITQMKNCLNGLFLITPNIPEAEEIWGNKLKAKKEICSCAKYIQNHLGVKNVLITGGHGEGDSEDFLLDVDGGETWFSCQKEGFSIHGTGSFLNAAISIGLYRDKNVVESIEFAKELINLSAKKATAKDPILRI